MHFLPTAPRALAAAALGLAVANVVHLWSLLLRAISSGEQPFHLSELLLRLVLLSLGPLLVATAIRRAGRASYSLEAERLVIRRRRAVVDIPFESIAEVRLSRLPFPTPALAFRLRSGRMARRIEVPDPASLLEALAPRVPSAEALRGHRQIAFATARAPTLRRRGRRVVVKFVLFPLVPALVLFHAYQSIGFGGPFGEYHLYGAAAYVRTLMAHAVGAVAVLLLYAAAWRIVGETCAVIATAVWPDRARTCRRIVEGVCAVAYYAGVPAFLGLRFLA
jgi:hypothetical protein